MAQSDLPPASMAVLVVALVILSAGCVGISGDDSSVTTLEEDLEATTPPDEVAATVEMTVEADGNTTQYDEPVWLRNDGTSRLGDHERGSEFVRVDDGERVWKYDVGNDSVSVRDSNATENDYLSFLYEEQARYLEEYAVTQVEETTVDGRDAYHVVFDPPPNETIERSISIAIGRTEYVVPLETSERDETGTHADHVELWIDREHHFPLAYYTEADDFELTVEYTDVTFDEGLEDDLFSFSPPESATVEPAELEE